MDLSADQCKAIEAGQAVAVKFHETDCVVVRKDIFERIASQLQAGDEANDEELARLGWESGESIGWNSPEMSQYDHYDDYRK